MEHFLAKLSIMLVPALLAVTLHEVAHGWIADRHGDPTARLLGRLSLNPLRHLDPVGTLALMVFGFGWARPVPVLFGNLHHPRRDMVRVALAGPLANAATALACALLLRLIGALPAAWATGTPSVILEPVSLMAGFGLYINVILSIFNLIPIPPLDGGRVLIGIVPPRFASTLARLEPFGFVLVIVLIYFTGLWRHILAPLVQGVVALLAGREMVVVSGAIDFLFGG